MTQKRIAIIGLGITGSAIAAHLAANGHKVTGYEQFSACHANGSSHGENRLFRRVPAEGAAYVEMAARAFPLWQKLEQESGRALFNVNGALDISAGGNSRAQISYDLAKQYSCNAEQLTIKQAQEKLPFFNFESGMEITITPQSGILKAEESITAFHEIAKRHNADLRFNANITELDFESKKIITLERGQEAFDTIILCAGSWVETFVDLQLIIEKSVLGWYDVEGNKSASGLPGFSYHGDKDGFYGMPSLDGRSFKIGHDRQNNIIRPTNFPPDIDPRDERILNEGIKRHFKDLSLKDPRFKSCKITHARNGNFIIDRHPDFADILIFSPCSGHGFKYAPVYGEIAQSFIEETALSFSLDDFKIMPREYF